MTSNADSRCYTKLDWLWKNVEPIIFHVTSILPHLMSYKKGLLIQFDQECGIIRSAVQTPGFSPPAPAPAKKTPAPGKKLRLRQKTCEN